jgi:hypothetical protein
MCTFAKKNVAQISLSFCMLCFAWGRGFSTSTHVVGKWASCKELSLSLECGTQKRER